MDPDPSVGPNGSVEQPEGSISRRPNSDFPVGEPTYRDFVADPETPKWVEDFYVNMRTRTDDVPKVAEAAGLDPALVEVAKRNVFVNTHDVAIGPGDLRHGYFTPLEQIADLWKEAMEGTLKGKPKEINELRSLIAHEYVEAKLLEAGMPYNYADPDLYDDDGGYPDDLKNAGAHAAAPLSLHGTKIDLLRHWPRKLGLIPPEGGLAPDLSNLDEIVEIAKEGLEW
jgi:hypothetical protein